jgi:DNA-binding ferritin-like protein
MKKSLLNSEFSRQFLNEHAAVSVNDLFVKLASTIQNSPGYAELSIVLQGAQMLYLLHQTHHWQAKGDSFYGDHLLFERLYNDVLADIDATAEKSVGMGGIENVSLMPRIQNVCWLLECTEPQNVMPQPTQLIERSLTAELMFLGLCNLAADSLKAHGQLTRGVDNMLAGIEDKSEARIYLLRQRLSTL